MRSGCCIALEPGCGKLCLRRFRWYRIADASWRELPPNSVPLHAKTQSDGDAADSITRPALFGSIRPDLFTLDRSSPRPKAGLQTGLEAPDGKNYLGKSNDFGGAGGIRTLEGLLTLTHFPGVRLRPLGHRSACRARRQRRSPIARCKVVQAKPEGSAQEGPYGIERAWRARPVARSLIAHSAPTLRASRHMLRTV